jgi:hypothetical protein
MDRRQLSQFLFRRYFSDSSIFLQLQVLMRRCHHLGPSIQMLTGNCKSTHTCYARSTPISQLIIPKPNRSFTLPCLVASAILFKFHRISHSRYFHNEDSGDSRCCMTNIYMAFLFLLFCSWEHPLDSYFVELVRKIHEVRIMYSF